MGKTFNENNTPLFPLRGSFNSTQASPADSRLVVNTYSDLTNKDTWTKFNYKGMCVSVVADGSNNGLYMYIGNTAKETPVASDWVKIGEPNTSYDSESGEITIDGHTITLKDKVVSSGKIVSVSPKVKTGSLGNDQWITIGETLYEITPFEVDASGEPVNGYWYIYKTDDHSFYITPGSNITVTETTSTDETTGESTTVTTYGITNTNKLILFIFNKETLSISDSFKYLKLNIADDPNNPIYINVKDLVDVYTASNPSGNDVTVTINDSNLISASIVDESITTSKLDSTVQGNLSKASTSIQGTDVSTSSSDDIIGTDDNLKKVIKTTDGSGTVTIGSNTYSGKILTTTKFVKDYVDSNSTLYWEEDPQPQN